MGYLMKKTSILFLLLSLCFVSCAGEDDDDGVSVGGGSGPCKGVTCSGHGTCYEIGDNLVSCNCEEGYVAEGIDCVLDDGNGTDTGSDPCAGVTCSGHGNCYEKDGKPACNCEQGYNAQGTNCIEEGTSDPCAGKDCNNHGTCNASTGQCECEEGWKGDDCENFNNGGPWKVAVTGDVNEEYNFESIYCYKSDSTTNNGKKAITIELAEQKYYDPKILVSFNIEGNIARQYNVKDDYTNAYLSTRSGNMYLTHVPAPENYAEPISVNVVSYDNNAISGRVELKYGKFWRSKTNTSEKVINVDPKIFDFKCPLNDY